MPVEPHRLAGELGYGPSLHGEPHRGTLPRHRRPPASRADVGLPVKVQADEGEEAR